MWEGCLAGRRIGAIGALCRERFWGATCGAIGARFARARQDVVMVSHLDLLAQLEHVAQVHERRVRERRRARGHAAVLFAERRELWVDIRVV